MMSNLETHAAAEAVLLHREDYAGLAINSAKDLACAVARHTSKALDIKVSTVDKGAKSSVVFKESAFLSQLAAMQDVGPEATENLVKAYKNSLADAAGYFGYVTKVSSVQPDFVVSFSKTF